jgi:hypothetical protein
MTTTEPTEMTVTTAADQLDQFHVALSRYIDLLTRGQDVSEAHAELYLAYTAYKGFTGDEVSAHAIAELIHLEVQIALLQMSHDEKEREADRLTRALLKAHQRLAHSLTLPQLAGLAFIALGIARGLKRLRRSK